jgi:hypothetical protein
MDGTVLVQIPVTPEAAAALADEERRRQVGAYISDLLRCASPEAAQLAALIREIKRDARAAGLTDADIDAELAAYNAERRD